MINVIKVDILSERMEELMALSHEKTTASESFADAVNAAATDSGASKAVIKKLITARIKNTEEQDKADAESFAALIEQVA